MFTFSFSSAFAAFGDVLTGITATTAAGAAEEFSDYVDDELGLLTYDTKGNLKTWPTGVDSDTAKYTYLDKNVIDGVAGEIEQKYLTAIYSVTSDFTAQWHASTTTDGKFTKEGDFLKMLFAGSWLTKMNDAQVAKEEQAAYDAVAVDLSLYTTVNQNTILTTASTGYNASIVAIETAMNTYNASIKDATAAKTAVTALQKAAKDFTDFLKTIPTIAEGSVDIGTATTAAIQNLLNKSEAFVEFAETSFFDVTAETAMTAQQKANKASFEDDVDKLVEYFQSVIDLCVLNGYTPEGVKLERASDVTAVLDKVNVAVNDAFRVDKTFDATTFVQGAGAKNCVYYYVEPVKTAELLSTAVEKDAADKKVERKADGTLRYRAIDVDKALADAKSKINEELYQTLITFVGGDLNGLPMKLTLADNTAYALQAYKKDAIDDIKTGDYQLAKWYGERAAKVKAIQDEYEEKILVAESADDIDALVEDAQDAMDAILRATEIASLKTRTDARAAANGYTDVMLGNYFDAVMGTKNYDASVRAGAIAAAKAVFKDAVIATENATISHTEIDKLIAANKDAAMAALVDVKTVTELKALGVAVKDEIAKIPANVTLADKEVVLAAQKAMDDFLDNAGASKAYVANVGKLTAAMNNLMRLEAKAVNDAIRALPKTITVEDAEKVKAAKDAYKALETTYGAYDGVVAANHPADLENYLGQTIQSLVTKKPALDEAETDLEAAKVERLAKLVTALNANSTDAEVLAAKAAFDDLTTVSKLSFNNELYVKLMDAVKAIGMSAEDAKAYVQDLKITARSAKTSKGVKVTIKADVQELLDNGYTVEYKFYRSTKSNKNFGKAMITKTTGTYTNTKGVKGTKYYYKAKLVVKNAAGEVVATTPLTQCLYATRTF